ncbi:hypothetical protein KL86DYS2_12516 [uncultured Dysgonomonas sp.]|uniref:Uncharacterized protein n=1 Tax=uncultured Dysgonomonas sp. TaxID=206096 RepID=A0A212JWZ8_9BACT|nr:hypothetical protein [uncultured Dysgonomonas sp.]SBW03888.1 hypothetical protein KL86DYS2_12516 [uncultured Dysgonomonas sp.]
MGKVDESMIEPEKLFEAGKHANNEKPRFIVSKATANFIDCLYEMDKLYSLTYDALEEMYGEDTADELIKGDFWGKYNAVQSVINTFIIDSISYNIGKTRNATEI